MKTIRILIVDDLPKVREGLATVLTLAASTGGLRIEVAGEACDGHEAVRQTQRLQPDVVLMDLEMQGLDGCTATQCIKAIMPAVRVIILSIQNDAEALQRARAAGADGYVVKGSRLEDLLQAVTGDSNTINNEPEGENNES